MSGLKPLFSELLRPLQLGDLTLPQRDIDRLQRMLDEGTIMNMLFYGSPGLGKTSAANILIKNGNFSKMEINGSSETGIDFVRTKIEGFAYSGSVMLRPKICFIDEADYLSKNAQAALRRVIEKSSRNCRFLLSANDIDKMVPAIRSRLKEICFDVGFADRVQVQARLIERYKAKLVELGVKHDDKRLIEIIGIYYPDLRAIANQIEFEFS
jgi:replication factor C subunit 3/5